MISKRQIKDTAAAIMESGNNPHFDIVRLFCDVCPFNPKYWDVSQNPYASSILILEYKYNDTEIKIYIGRWSIAFYINDQNVITLEATISNFFRVYNDSIDCLIEE